MIRGKVIVGNRLASELGYPTANLDIGVSSTQLSDGVYAAWASLRGQKYAAALIIQRAVKKVEVHLLNYNGNDFYAEQIEVQAVQRISEIERVDSAALKQKISEDVELVKQVLKL